MIAGYILTGGQNRRMNGRKKLFLDYQGETFCQRLLNALAPLQRIYLSVESKLPYTELNLPMVVDIQPKAGPMGGIYSGLFCCPEDALFVVACDMPFVDRETVEKVIAAYEQTGKLTLVEIGGRVQPLFGVYPKSLWLLLESLIWEGSYRMYDMLELTDYQTVSIARDSHAADNINTLEEYQKLVNNN